MSVVKFLLLQILVLKSVRADSEAIVQLPDGKVEGVVYESDATNKEFFSFKGIPYAKPNLGSEKFQAPLPPEPWSDTLDASEHKDDCMFFCEFRKTLIGSEDCLNLNVYTTSLDENAGKPVMVLLQGIGFMVGTASDDIFGADYFMLHDVVVVTFNYRLGVFGFINSLDSSTAGNAGLKDQVMLLKWVQKNIKYFGGSPDKVTLFGMATGAACIQYHLMSPMSRGLFHGAIMESGNLINSFSFTDKPTDAILRLGNALGYGTQDVGAIVAKLKNEDNEKIIMANRLLGLNDNNYYNGHLFLFLPSVEANNGQEIFLSTTPWDLVKSGSTANVPILVGICKDDALPIAHLIFEYDKKDINQHLGGLAPDDLNITDSNTLMQIGGEINKFYFDGRKIEKQSTAKELGKLLTDMFHTYGINFWTTITASKNSAPIYNYLYTYDSQLTIAKIVGGFTEGVLHGDEVLMMWYSNLLGNEYDEGSPEQKLNRLFLKMWTNFAKFGDPTPELDENINTKWEPLGSDGKYVEINLQLTMKKDLFKERVNFWIPYYKEILGDYLTLFN